jgi:hypothetical protein
VSIRDHRTRSAYKTHGRAELKGRNASTRAEWLARKTAKAKKRAKHAAATPATADPYTGDDKE